MKRWPGYPLLIPLAVFFALAPFSPQPHLVEKLGMLLNGTLRRPLDIFDLFWHAWPLALLAWRVGVDARQKLRRQPRP